MNVDIDPSVSAWTFALKSLIAAVSYDNFVEKNGETILEKTDSREISYFILHIDFQLSFY